MLYQNFGQVFFKSWAWQRRHVFLICGRAKSFNQTSGLLQLCLPINPQRCETGACTGLAPPTRADSQKLILNRNRRSLHLLKTRGRPRLPIWHRCEVDAQLS